MDQSAILDLQRYFKLLYRIGESNLKMLKGLVERKAQPTRKKTVIQRDQKLLGKLMAVKTQLHFSPREDRTSFPLWIWDVLLEQGESLYATHRLVITQLWGVLQETSSGELDLKAGLQAGLGHSLACAAYNLAELPDREVWFWLHRSSSLWKGLSLCNLEKLAESYEREEEPTRYLLLDAMLVRAKMTHLVETLYFTLGARLLNSNTTECDSNLALSAVNEEVITKMKAILKKPDVMNVYKDIFMRTNPQGDFQIAFKQAFRVKPVTSDQLFKTWDLYGVTLRADVMYVDLLYGDYDDTLCDAYQLCQILHEFAHLLVRQGKTKWGEFHAVAPNSQSQALAEDYAMLQEPSTTAPLQEELPTSAVSLKRKASRIDPGTSKHPKTVQPPVQVPLPASDLAPRDPKRPAQLQICEDIGFNEKPRKDAGDQIEEELFLGHLVQLRMSAAEKLLEWATTRTSLQEFAALFKELNESSATANEQSAPMGRSRRSTEQRSCVVMREVCGRSQNVKERTK